MRILLCALALSAVASASVIGGSTELNVVRTHPHAQSQTAAVHRVIVKLRAGATTTVPGRAQILAAHDRVANLASRAGLTLQDSREISDRMHAMRVEPASAGESIEATLARLKADPDIEYAVPDERRYIHAVPNDPLYPLGGQWYERADASTPAAVNAQAAWDSYTTGDPNLVIADLDTGVRFDHPDLQALANGGRLLPGYDFVSNKDIANDNDGWDPDPSDPGDWVSAADQSNPVFKDCEVEISSWHGTRTAGILGALTNNARGIAAMSWQGKILPVRVLGKCGNYDSDIIQGMNWAAGLHVAGVPDNANPARIINMSLGAKGSCLQSYADVINKVTSMGVLVVVSAGNEGGPVDSPANCAGVAGVAGIRHAGTKVGFSSLGPEVSVSAPAGNCVNTNVGDPCLYSIQTTTNSGTMGPTLNDDAYTGTISLLATQPKGANLGTSFSAPIVSGIAELMLSVNSKLSSCGLIARLKEGASPFPQTATSQTPLPACHVPTGSSDLQDQCICTLDGKTCGAGMANAKGAVEAALRPIAAVSLPSGTLSGGQSVTLDAGKSAAANGHTISTYQWTNVGKQSISIQGATSAATTVTTPSCGYGTVQITVTDDVGRVDTANVVLSPTSATSTAVSDATTNACTVSSPPQALLAVCPATADVQASGGSQPFTVSVANTTNDAVTWQVNGVPGGNSTVGTITSAGVYTAPSTVPAGAQVTISAVSTVDQSLASSSTATITSPPKHGGGGMDPLTLVGGALALGVALRSRRYARR